ncbi:MAG: hypothetical protein AMXMBFR64_28810 [Myxococcales bacterium]
MGADKALLALPGDERPLVRVLADRLAELFSTVVVVARRPELLDVGTATPLVDLPGRSDPLGAVATALSHLRPRATYTFVCAVDMPGLHPPLVRALCELAEPGRIVAPAGPRGMEPLHAVWPTDVADHLLCLHDGGLRRLQAVRDHLPVRVILREELFARGLLPPWALDGVNTPDALARFLAERGGR